jgi:hypothetical protein
MLKTENAPTSSSRLFRTGGYFVMHSPGSRIVFDFGPLGYLSTAAHGHADALSLTGTINRSLDLVDPGTYAYQEGGKWRQFFRGTSAHNSLVVDGLNQSELMGSFLWGRKAKSRLLGLESGSEFDLVVAEHDGYKEINVIHRRMVLFLKPDCIAIKDQLLGHGIHTFEQLWHFLPGVIVNVEGSWVRIQGRRIDYAFLQLGDINASFDVVEGQESPIQGWYSPHYYQKDPAPVLRYFGQANLPASFTTVFIPVELSSGDHWIEKQTKLQSLLNKY